MGSLITFLKLVVVGTKDTAVIFDINLHLILKYYWIAISSGKFPPHFLSFNYIQFSKTM